MATRNVDFLVIGSGVSGLIFASRASQIGKVLIITKDKREESATKYAQGGIAAAVGKMDLPENHYQDTLTAGAGLCDPEAVQVLVNEGISRVNELIEKGMQFTLDENGKLHLGREGGHGQHRILHAYDYTGRALEDFLLNIVGNIDNIEILEHHIAIDLITEHHLTDEEPKNCFGVYALNQENSEIFPIIANYTCIAAGGAGQVYPHTTNPAVCTGDGVAMAYRAGCQVRNLEFVQFHPTAFYAPEELGSGEKSFLISEAVRGHGARLILKDGSAFMHKHHELKELAPRDIVARAIDFELKRTGNDCVYLDVTHMPAEQTKEHFPLIYQTLRDKYEYDLTKEPIPVVPAAHYLCGGIKVDLNSRTNLNFLYCAGEASSTGVHGGNRLASNSLLEGLVFSTRAALHAIEEFKAEKHKEKAAKSKLIPKWHFGAAQNLEEWILVKHDRVAMQKLMWDYVGIVRTTQRLEIALRRIDLIYSGFIDFYRRTVPTREIIEVRNQILTSQLIVRAALKRKESRGLHYSTDYPENREPSREDTILERLSLRGSASSTA